MTDENPSLVPSSLGATLEQANPAPVELEDPGLVLGGRVELRSQVGDAESVSWVEYQACPAGSCDWQALARSQAAPFAALVETAALPDGDYDMRLLVGRREGQIEASRPLRRRLLANKPTVSLRQPQPGAWVGGAVALVARVSAAAAGLPLRFQFSSDHTSWRPMLRASRAGPEAAIWYTSGLPDGDYLLRALAGAEGAQAVSEPVEVHLDNAPPECKLVEPTQLAVLRGSVRLLAEASDAGSGVAAVEFRYARTAEVWTPLGSTASMPFGLLWQTHRLPDGHYRLRCLARDCIGNQAASEEVAVLLANMPFPGRPPESAPPLPPPTSEPDRERAP
jgi:hypothetical protein